MVRYTVSGVSRERKHRPYEAYISIAFHLLLAVDRFLSFEQPLIRVYIQA